MLAPPSPPDSLHLDPLAQQGMLPLGEAISPGSSTTLRAATWLSSPHHAGRAASRALAQEHGFWGIFSKPAVVTFNPESTLPLSQSRVPLLTWGMRPESVSSSQGPCYVHCRQQWEAGLDKGSGYREA